LIAFLGAHRGQWITRAELLDALYADREDGGPAGADAVLQVTLHRMRAAGIPIESTHVYRLPPRRWPTPGAR
jgi:hypothetical protein